MITFIKKLQRRTFILYQHLHWFYLILHTRYWIVSWIPRIISEMRMANSETEKETATAPAVEVRYCGPRETRFACPVPQCTFRSTGIMQSLKRHFDLKHKDLAWGGLSVTCTKSNTLMPSQCSLKKASEHFRVCTAVQPITTAVATPLKYACPVCQVLGGPLLLLQGQDSRLWLE